MFLKYKIILCQTQRDHKSKYSEKYLGHFLKDLHLQFLPQDG